MEITGKIIQICDVQSGVAKASGKPWKKRSYVLETQETYPRKICFIVFGEDKVDNFDRIIALGKNVRVSIDIESREYMGRWYTDINAWKVEDMDSQPAQATAPADQYAPSVQGAPVPPPPAVAPAGSDDDLPF